MDATTATALTPAARQLGAIEARRMLRHPAYPVALLYPAVFAVSAMAHHEGGPRPNFVYQLVFLSLFLAYAPVTLVAANRTAAATYRRSVRDPFDGAPVDDRQRAVAVILGLLRGPLLVGLIGIPVLLALQEFTTGDTADRSDAVYPRTALEYLQLPAIVLGAGLLGIAVARWLPWPGALPLVAIVIWFGTIGMTEMADGAVMHGRTWFALWPVWVDGAQGMLPRQPLDQEMWHLTYLLGLGVLAGIAALLRTSGPRRALWLAAGAAVAVTVLASWQQLG
ncbi:hypothetical protein ODJ79_16015 [Actinoplanes sp. KI2]|uniref:hypothetical protein n=1 Tax=Actinoplanes sp. KI2 TaxID=2983315 RepID=UPI0021D5F7F8|nr:hypothetical protein [Actinoplanes sp. KI2]MCU7725235.1 hypothetical protein [Actinoplanes sp. KI2]